MPRTPRIHDSSLQDGAASAGQGFALQDRLEIAKRLDALGVHEIAAAWPARSALERESVRALAHLGLRARLCVSAGFDPREVAQCAGLGARLIDIAVPLAEPDQAGSAGAKALLTRLVSLLSQARDLGLEACVGLEDASRADPAFLLQLAEVAARAGAVRLRYADSAGLLDPFATHRVIRGLRSACRLKIEMHASNRLGLATANTLAAARAGATHLRASLHGRAQPALDEIVPALQQCYGLATGIAPEALSGLRRRLARTAGSRPLPIQVATQPFAQTAVPGVTPSGSDLPCRFVAIESARADESARARPARRPRPPCC
ncbi:hypothetical protein ACFONG_20355 [Uliginosibacterium paludis]|uniref:Homocitrate synthase n=1 Tax=Uliginosibacterium paludis TaxID=1615952 RepID=A0ABV2CVY3_9RHOO